MKYLIFSIIFLTEQVTVAQKWKIGLGATAPLEHKVARGSLIGDSGIAVLKKSMRTLKNVNRVFPEVYLERTLLIKGRTQLSAAVSYQQRDMNIAVLQAYPKRDNERVYQIVHTFLFQLSGGFRPAKRLAFFAGLGAGLHFNGFHRSLGHLDDPNSYHPLFRETYEAAQDIHRPITLNYHLSVRYALLRRVELIVHLDESISNVQRKMRIDNVEYDYQLSWRNVGVMLAYRFSPAELARGFVNFFKPEKKEL